MCSNTCNTVCGCGTGGGNVSSSIWNSSLKKQHQKRPRVPKRGPGVAELEKILREQETIDISDTSKGEPFPSPCFVTHHSNSDVYSSSASLKSHPPTSLSSPALPSTNLPHHVPSVPKFDHLGPTTPPNMTSIYSNCGSLIRTCGSGLISSEKELFPLNLSSAKSKSNLNEEMDAIQHDVPIKKRNDQYLSPMMSQFIGTGPPISSGSLSIGLQNCLEPPSNQTPYYNCTSRASPEERKMVGMKRSHSSLENSLIPPSNFHVLPSFSHYNRTHQSSINDGHGASSFNSTKECYRDAKWGSTLELSSTRFNSDIVVAGHANFPPFTTPEVPSPPLHLFQGVLSKGNMLPCQVIEDKIEDSYQRSESNRPNCRPFYNFLEVKDREGVIETIRGLNHGGRVAGRGGIDLSLKL